jgi:hypothetical protein
VSYARRPLDVEAEGAIAAAEIEAIRARSCADFFDARRSAEGPAGRTGEEREGRTGG